MFEEGAGGFEGEGAGAAGDLGCVLGGCGCIVSRWRRTDCIALDLKPVLGSLCCS